MVRAGIVPENKDQLGTFHVLQRGCTLADAKCLCQGYTRRLVAHIRTVWKIVGPELAREQLQKKGRLVGGLSRSIEGRLIGRIQTVQLLRNHRKSFWPSDRLI